VNTKRTILSPFTKEYRVLSTQSSIHLFLEGAFSFREGPTVLNRKCSPFTFGCFKLEWNEVSFFSVHINIITTMDCPFLLSPIRSEKNKELKDGRRCCNNATFSTLSKFLLLTWLKCSGTQAQVSFVVMLTLFTCTQYHSYLQILHTGRIFNHLLPNN
jgi:hypothetical protein